jgi:hypothetical protein
LALVVTAKKVLFCFGWGGGSDHPNRKPDSED